MVITFDKVYVIIIHLCEKKLMKGNTYYVLKPHITAIHNHSSQLATGIWNGKMLI